MDGGRTSQPGDRRVINRSEPTRLAEEPQPIKEAPRRVYEPEAPSVRAKKEDAPRKRKFALPIVVAILVLVVVLGGWFAWSRMQNTGTAIDSSKYQAVFFTNGQVYFGKLKSFDNNYLKLTDIYYLQTQSTDTESANPQKTSTDQNNVQLIKLGDEIHGPEDEMVISKDQVLFYENLKVDGKVAKSIANYKTNTKQ